MVEITSDATVSRTVLTAEGVRLVLFSFDTGQELSEHTAVMPVLLQVLEGNLTVSAGDRSVHLRPGGVVHLPARVRGDRPGAQPLTPHHARPSSRVMALGSCPG